MAKSQTKRQASLLDYRYLWIIAASLLPILLLDGLNLEEFEFSSRVYLPLHIAMELASMVVCFAVFTTAWYGYRQASNKRDLLIGITFAATGVLDFVHVLSYRGMPSFLTINAPGTAAAYWLVGRLLVGIGLLVSVFVRPHSESRLLSPKVLVPLALGIVAVMVAFITAHASQVNRMLWAPGEHPLTATKIILEYLAIAIYATAFLALSERRGWDATVVRNLRCALLLAAFSELSLTLYTTPFGPMNALGHIFKTASNYMILAALFVSTLQRPYEQLSRAKDELNELYLDAQDHRREIEKSFAHIGSALSSSLRLNEALERIAELAADMLHADFAIVASVDKHLELTQLVSRGSACHEADRPFDITRIIGKRAMEERRSVIENDMSTTGLVDCDFSQSNCLRSMVCAPTVHGGNVLGLITICSHTVNAFVEGDVKLLEGFAAHAAIAISNAMSYERESHIADVLQKSFLSSAKIRMENFEIAQVYQPAMDEALVGGDFYDVIHLEGNKIGLVIGDVSGKGLAAAVHTAMAKYTLRAYLNEGHTPAEAIRLLDQSVSKFSSTETFITLFFGLLDINTGEMTYVNAGHEPAIYCRDGVFLTLQSTGPVLGLGIHEGYVEGKTRIEKGGILIFYTDGISEARQGKQFLGTEGIGEVLLRCEDKSSEDVAECIYKNALEFAGGELKDDVAILAVRAI